MFENHLPFPLCLFVSLMSFARVQRRTKIEKNNDDSWKILQILNIFYIFERSLRKYNATATIVFLGSWRKTFQGLRINTKGKNFWPNPLENHIKLILFQHSSLEKNEFTLIYVFSKILNLVFLSAEKSTKYHKWLKLINVSLGFERFSAAKHKTCYYNPKYFNIWRQNA